MQARIVSKRICSEGIGRAAVAIGRMRFTRAIARRASDGEPFASATLAAAAWSVMLVTNSSIPAS